MTSYSFVIDMEGKPLSPTKEEKAWYMIRKGKAKLICKYPMTIQLNRVVPNDEICSDEIRCGIDDGGKHVGIALVQKCQSYNKVLFKGQIEQRKDVKRLMEVRHRYRRYRRYMKRYREERYFNRSSSKRKGRIPPSILQKKQAIIRVITKLSRWINITSYWLEDVAIDMHVLTVGYKPYNWQYLKSYRLDENLRLAVLKRDGFKCKECGATKTKLEVHHIKPRRLNGSNTLNNLISLCTKCHSATIGNEEQYMQHYYDMLGTSKIKNLASAEHVMMGKNWLREQLSLLGTLNLTNGCDTANKRIDWDIEKSHANDAICITELYPRSCEVKEWDIRPMRRQSKSQTDNVLGIRHRDYIEYVCMDGSIHRGYVIALSPKFNAVSFTSPTKTFRKISAKKCKFLWRYSKIYWFEKVS